MANTIAYELCHGCEALDLQRVAFKSVDVAGVVGIVGVVMFVVLVGSQEWAICCD